MTNTEIASNAAPEERVLVKLFGGFGLNALQILAGHALAQQLSHPSRTQLKTEVLLPEPIEPSEQKARNPYDIGQFPNRFETLGGYLKSDLHFQARHRDAGLPALNDLREIFPALNWRKSSSPFPERDINSDINTEEAQFDTLDILAALEENPLETTSVRILNFHLLRSFFPHLTGHWQPQTSEHIADFTPSERVLTYLQKRYAIDAPSPIFGIHLRTLGRFADATVHGHKPAKISWYLQSVDDALEHDPNLRVLIVANQIENNPAQLDQAYTLYQELERSRTGLDITLVSDEPWYIDFALLRTCDYLALSSSTFGFAAGLTSRRIKKIYVPRAFQDKHFSLINYPEHCTLESDKNATILTNNFQLRQWDQAPKQAFNSDATEAQLTLVTTFYLVSQLKTDEKAADRQEEYELALKRNLRHPQVRRVVLFVQGEEAFERLKGLNLPNRHKLNCLVIRTLGTRHNFQPMMRDLIGYCQRHLVNEICILSTADSCLADEFYLDQDELPPGSNKVIALTRHEADGSTPQLDFYRGSHDAFIFRSPLLRLDHSCFDFFQNDPGCENVVIAKLVEAGYRLSNPAHRLKIIHLHNSQVREGPATRVNHGIPYFRIRPEPRMVLVYNEPKTTTFSFVVHTHQADHRLDVIINCLLAQTSNDWKMLIVSDGPEPDTAARMEPYCHRHPNIIYGHLEAHHGDAGYSTIEAGVRACINNSQYAIMTAFQHYYVPVFVDCFKAAAIENPAVIHCNFILNHPRDGRQYAAFIDSKVQPAFIDMGCIALRNDYLKELAFSNLEYAERSTLVEDIRKMIRRRGDRVSKVNQTLFSHN
ncbi:hypothetical protein KHP57_15750 [Algiphilus sp. NNCM1]|nr:hypothetical protein [Algiphilus acroporae]MCI5043574.1 hypothetical protein [Aquisalinus sp.]